MNYSETFDKQLAAEYEFRMTEEIIADLNQNLGQT